MQSRIARSIPIGACSGGGVSLLGMGASGRRKNLKGGGGFYLWIIEWLDGEIG